MSVRSPFSGVMTALPTPFDRGSVDFRAFAGLIERQLAAETRALVIGGSTGEATSLSPAERVSLFEFACGVVKGRRAVVAGVGHSDTRIATELAHKAQGCGATGLLATTPAYVRPPQRGLEAHFGAIAEAATLPILLYNIPSRTGVDLLPETVGRIVARHPQVVAIKESSGSLDRIAKLVAMDVVDVLSGDDEWVVDHVHAGAVGLVSVVANLAPGRMALLVQALASGEERDAIAQVESLRPLIQALSLETNPGPLKAALDLLGLCGSEVRLPLVPIEDETRSRVATALIDCGLTGK